MRRILTLAFALLGMFIAQKSSASIYGPYNVCIGSSSLLYDSSASGSCTGGTWSSSNPAVAVIGASTGVVSGISAGVSIITYVCGSGISTAAITVDPLPAAVTGGTTPICVGSSTTVSCATTGGYWYSSSSSIASVVSATGVVTGHAAGTASIRYTVSGGCYSERIVTVNSVTVDSVTGPTSVCVGSTITMACITPGGAWSSSSPTVAAVDAVTGVITGMSSGTATITYSVSGSCGTGYNTRVVTVTSSTSAGTITGTTSVMAGMTTTLSSTVSGGTWSSSSTSIATVSATGVVTGVATGAAVISYAVSGCGGIAYATTTVTVTVPDCISGNVLFTSGSYYGPVRVWLIKYNPSTHMLYAVDSQYLMASGTSVGYSFCSIGTDSFRVKAACDSTAFAGTGYQPTYHTASAYWHSATVINHTAGTHDMGKDITMGYGTVTSGPGFIAGDVTTGANKGTADGSPVANMLIFCVDNATGNIIQQTATDAAGHYTFSSLPVGTYKIYPEAINYATTPYISIAITSSASSVTAMDFVQHTLSMTITPKTSGVNTVTAHSNAIDVFPNPATGVLNIHWNAENAGNGTVVIRDVTGREILSTSVNMTQNNGSARVDLSNVAKGIYMVTVKADGVSYSGKIQVQ